MGRLPFETGYLSTMSENELLILFDELRHTNFWEVEEAVQKIIDNFMENHWGPRVHPSATYAAHVPPMKRLVVDHHPFLDCSVEYRNIHLNIPPQIDERAARLFAEIQVREQLDPAYDPTEAET